MPVLSTLMGRRRILLVAGGVVFLSFVVILVSSYHEQLPAIDRIKKMKVTFGPEPIDIDLDMSRKTMTAAECAARLRGAKPTANKNCNPLLKPGWVDLESNAWVPVAREECPPVPYADLHMLTKFLKGRRIYFYGDSVNRNAHSDFCKNVGAEVQPLLPNPKGYLTTSDLQAIHFCEIPNMNFFAINVYTFGLREYDNTDLDFLIAHDSIHHRKGDDPAIWSFENRMTTPHQSLVDRFGTADIIVISSGLWDLVSLQQHVVRQYEQDNIPQKEQPPADFIDYYTVRVRKYIQLARELHKTSLKQMLFLPLHQPGKLDFPPPWGMNGLPANETNVKFSGTSAFRAQALRDVHYAVVEEEPDDVIVMPFDRLIRSIPENGTIGKMADDIHPSGFANSLLTMGTVLAMKNLNIGDPTNAT